MEELNFDFNPEKKGMMTVNITNFGIYFNELSIKALGYPEFVAIAVDKQKKLIGIKPANKDDNALVFSFVTSDKKRKRLVITSRKIMNNVIEIFGKWFDRKGQLFGAEKIGEMLIIDFNSI